MTSRSEPEVTVSLRVTAAWQPAGGRLQRRAGEVHVEAPTAGPPPAVAQLLLWLQQGGFELTTQQQRGRRVKLSAVARWGGEPTAP